MLPKHIAEALVEGRKIEPIVRDNEHPVTVFFSDIVGPGPLLRLRRAAAGWRRPCKRILARAGLAESCRGWVGAAQDRATRQVRGGAGRAGRRQRHLRDGPL